MLLRTSVIALLLSTLSSPALSRTMPIWSGSDMVGAVNRLHATFEDTLAAIGDRESLGYLELVHANPDIDPWLPGEGAQIILPSRFILPEGPREGIVVNLAEYRLYFFQGNEVSTYPVGVGTSTSPSPLTQTKVTMRLESPTWYPPESVRQEHLADGDPLPRIVPPGPENPLGPFALQLAEEGYLIHGTNKRFGIGMQVSHGCIRMYNQDISELIWKANKGTPVRIIDQPVKFGIQENMLWVEVHRGHEETSPEDQDRLWRAAMEQIKLVEKRQPGLELNRRRLELAIESANGIPQRVGEIVPTQLAADEARRSDSPEEEG